MRHHTAPLRALWAAPSSRAAPQRQQMEHQAAPRAALPLRHAVTVQKHGSQHKAWHPPPAPSAPTCRRLSPCHGPAHTGDPLTPRRTAAAVLAPPQVENSSEPPSALGANTQPLPSAGAAPARGSRVPPHPAPSWEPRSDPTLQPHPSARPITWPTGEVPPLPTAPWSPPPSRAHPLSKNSLFSLGTREGRMGARHLPVKRRAGTVQLITITPSG